MKTHHKIIAALAVAVCMAFGSLGFAACDSTPTDKTEKPDYNEQIHAIYEKYAETAGDDALTYDEWLETIKGKDGKSAYEIWKDNGHEGSETDFLAWLKGDKGDRGNGWLYGEGEPDPEKGVEGDLYLDLSAGEVYTKESTGWEKSGLSLKGSGPEESGDGKDTPVSPSEKDEPGGGAVTITAAGVNVAVSQLSKGAHIILADLGTAQTTDRIRVQVGEGPVSELVHSEKRSRADHNIYFGYMIVPDGGAQATIKSLGSDGTSGGANISATISFKEYEQPVLKADGVYIEVPVNLANTTLLVEPMNGLTFKYDSSVTPGKYIFGYKTDNLPVLCVALHYGPATSTFSILQGDTVSQQKNLTASDCAFEIYIEIAATSFSQIIFPMSINLTQATV